VIEHLPTYHKRRCSPVTRLNLLLLGVEMQILPADPPSNHQRPHAFCLLAVIVPPHLGCIKTCQEPPSSPASPERLLHFEYQSTRRLGAEQRPLAEARLGGHWCTSLVNRRPIDPSPKSQTLQPVEPAINWGFRRLVTPWP